ncbi:hypothetical protein OCA8868_00388 [Octadecabacter ascidiaceicola]|uniref:Uncharacterized protein n=1 Tax=Octadecabacter ascidiaceicola TaxID=1655543 RepID=A0A238JNN0_9RHOB|nr:hypothetical protein OCA8868_00388 [Octadecabacter ascidiaceicola]
MVSSASIKRSTIVGTPFANAKRDTNDVVVSSGWRGTVFFNLMGVDFAKKKGGHKGTPRFE